MDNKELQKNRMKTYFMEAAKGIILEEGFQNISVRKVADRAGYSYATLYNYFKDLDHLLWYVGIDLLKDLKSNLAGRSMEQAATREELIHNFKYYTNFFLDNPNAYRFIYFYQSGERPEELEKEAFGEDLKDIMIRILSKFVQEGKIKPEHMEGAVTVSIYSLQGMLVMYFSNKVDMKKADIFKGIETVVDYILSK